MSEIRQPIVPASGPAAASTVQADAPAIDFTLPDADANPVTLADYLGRNVVLAFYPADWSPVCTHELALFQETLGEIHARNAELLAISTDTVCSHHAWAEREHLTFPLLSDFWPHGHVARQYGVFREREGMATRALFFIDAAGTIRDAWISDDPTVAPGINLVFDALDRMQQQPDVPDLELDQSDPLELVQQPQEAHRA